MKHISEILINQKDNDNIAVIYGDKKMSYRQLYLNALSYSMVLREDKRDKVVLLYANCIELVIAFFAAWFADKTVIPLSSGLSLFELEQAFKFIEPAFIITPRKDLEGIAGNAQVLAVCYQESITGFNKELNLDKENEIAIILPTSGTTDNPKYAMLTHKNLLSPSDEMIRIFNSGSNVPQLLILPLHVIAAITMQFICVIKAGARLIIYDGAINPIKIANLIEKHKVEITGFTPSLALAITRLGKSFVNKMDSLKIIGLGGEVVTEKCIASVKQYYGSDIKCAPIYGMTEIGGGITDGTIDNLPAKSVGKPFGCVQFKIVEVEGYQSCEGQGELFVKGDSVFKGYYKNEELTEKCFQDGWFMTGDLVHFQDGCVCIDGRLKKMINVGGQKLNPVEVEEVLLDIEEIEFAYVTIMKDEILGEVPVAYIKLRENRFITESAILSALKKKLAKYKIPREIIFKESLDINKSGKIAI